MSKIVNTTFFFLVLILFSNAQIHSQNVELDSLIAKAIRNNNGINAGKMQVEASKANIGTAFLFEKTNVYYAYDQNNLALNNLPISVFGVQQKIAFPTVYFSQKSKYQAEYNKQQSILELQKNTLSLNVAKTYYHIVYLNHQETKYKYLDSLYFQFSKASERKFQLGESNYLEKITAESKYRKIQMVLLQLNKEKSSALAQMQSYVQSDKNDLNIATKLLAPINATKNAKELYNSYFENNSKQYQTNLSLQKKQLLPDINLEYFGGKNVGISQPLYGFQFGLAFPVLFSGQSAKIKTAKAELQSWELYQQNENQKITQFISQKEQESLKFQEGINYYNNYGKKLSSEILKVATLSFKQGEIDFFQYIQSLENATNIELDYLDNVFQFNKNQLDIMYLNYEK